jgi:hypothetical protein
MQKKFNAPNKTQIACYAAATGLSEEKTFCVPDEITAECTHPAVFFTGGKLV